MRLMPRSGQCVDCDKNAQLKCPTCPKGQTCQFSVPTDCTVCPKSLCLPDDSSSDDNSSAGGGGGGGDGGGGGGSSGPSAGPIAGGVVGGIAAIAIIAYLLWRFMIKPKRSREQQEQQQRLQQYHHHSVYEADTNPVRSHMEKDDAASRLTRRSSTRSVHSIASTVLTRASNIIQIAYIPGVTNRAAPTSPGVLVPPVPPIPMQHAEEGRERDGGDQHFFVPGELRDSTYSGISSYSDRTSYAPRSSIASTIYGKQAQIQTPAQTGMRAKPTVVSVKSAGGAGSNPNTPPVPSIDFDKFGSKRPDSSATAFTVGSMYLNNANTAMSGRAQVVKLGNGNKSAESIGVNSEASSSQESLDSSSSRDTSNAMTLVAESPSIEQQGPFSDPAERPRTVMSQPALGPVMEEEERRTSSPGSSRGSHGPFSDKNAAKTP